MQRFLNMLTETVKLILINIVWIGSFLLLYNWFPEFKHALFLGTLAAILYRVGETLIFGIGESWLREVLPVSFEKGKWNTSYHVIRFFSLLLIGAAGYSIGHVSHIEVLLTMIPVGVYFWFTMDLWHHVNYKYKQHREYGMIFKFRGNYE